MRTVMKVRRLGGAPPPPPPPLVPFESDAIAWLDAESLVGVYANGDPVPTWTATIDAANGSATQSGVGAIPSFDVDVDGSGKAGVVFNGSSHFMILGDAWKLAPTSSYTTYVVVKRNSTATSVILTWRDAGANTNILHQFVSTNRTIFAIGGTASVNVITPAFNSSDRKVISLLNYASPSDGFDALINGVLGASTATNSTGVPTISQPLIGARWNSAFTGIEIPMDGTIQCVLAYSTEHDATERATVLAFLYSRYGVVP